MPVLWCYVCGTGARRAADKSVAGAHQARTGCTLASSSSPTSTTFAPTAALAVTTNTRRLAPLFVLVLLVLLADLILLTALVLLVLLLVAFCGHPGRCLRRRGSLRLPCNMHAATRTIFTPLTPLTPLDVLSTVATLSAASCHTQGLLRGLQLRRSALDAFCCGSDTVGRWLVAGYSERRLPHRIGTGDARTQCRQIVHDGTSFVLSTVAVIVVITSTTATTIVACIVATSAPQVARAPMLPRVRGRLVASAPLGACSASSWAGRRGIVSGAGARGQGMQCGCDASAGVSDGC